MIKKFLLIAFFAVAAVLQAQQTTELKSNPRGLYIGAQGGVPLLWGDLFSLGHKTHMGYSGGIFAGYTVGTWFSPELSLDYGVGKLGAKSHQLNDYVNAAGIIKYLQQNPSDMKLGDIYSRTTFIQTGLRLQVSLLNLFSPDTYHPFDIELAPALYAQKFSPKLYAASDNQKLNIGIGSSNWNYGAGGDLGLRFRFSPRVSIHLRQSLIWLRNESFEGINNDPLWRVNLLANTSVGITFHIGKSGGTAHRLSDVKTETTSNLYQTETSKNTTQQTNDSERLRQEQQAREAESLHVAAEQSKAEAGETRKTYLYEAAQTDIPSIFFRRGYADIDFKRYQDNLEKMTLVLKKYSDIPFSIEGWCDITGTKSINDKLSQQRADALRSYLIDNGIAPERITRTKGMGVDVEKGRTPAARRAQVKLEIED